MGRVVDGRPGYRDRLIWPIGRWRDLPEVMKPAFDKLDNSLPSVSYINGVFYKNLWVKLNPVLWPEQVRFVLTTDDALVLTEDYGVEAWFLGGFLTRNRE